MNNPKTQIKHHFDHDAAKQILKEKYEAKMLFAAFDGLWKAGPELLTTLYIWDGKPTSTTIVLIDEYGNPCKVNVFELFDLANERWQEQMNAWHQEFEVLQTKR